MKTITIVEINNIAYAPPIQTLVRVLLSQGHQVNLIGNRLLNLPKDIQHHQNYHGYDLPNLCPILSNTGANKELVENDESGLIYEWENSADLADKIEGLLLDPAEIIRLAGNARERALEMFSLRKSVDSLIEVYRDVQKESVTGK